MFDYAGGSVVHCMHFLHLRLSLSCSAFASSTFFSVSNVVGFTLTFKHKLESLTIDIALLSQQIIAFYKYSLQFHFLNSFWIQIGQQSRLRLAKPGLNILLIVSVCWLKNSLWNTMHYKEFSLALRYIAMAIFQ